MKLSMVLLVGLLTGVCLRSRSAALRHWVLAASILCAGAIPLMERAAPSWPLNLTMLPAAAGHGPANGAVDVSVADRSGEDAPATPRAIPVAFGSLAAIWLLGSTFSLAVLGTGLARLAWLTSRGRPARSQWTALAEEIRREHRLRRPIALVESDHPSLLATWGIVRPRIIFPAGADEWSAELVRVILRHEIAHIRRGDWLFQMTGELVRAAYWFNPLAWLACRRLRAESEQACDDEVLAAGIEASDYAAHLVSLARHFSDHRTWFPAPAMARRSTLHRRVTAMLNTRLNRTPPAFAVRLATVALMVAATLVVAAAQASSTYSGTLYDPSGAVLPGVRVVLTSSDGAARETNSNASGQFQFKGLAAGTYSLEAQLPGFKSYKRDVNIAGTNVVQPIMLELGQVRETINIVDGGDSAMPVVREASPRPKPACGEPAANADAVRVGGNIRVPTKVKDVHPVFPAAMRGKEGDVVLDAVIGTDGFVHDIRVREGDQVFADAFVAAVTQWRFDATLLNCVAVDTPIMISGHFRPQVP